MEKYILDFMDYVRDAFDRITGNSQNGDKVFTATGATVSYIGSARQINFLKASICTVLIVDNIDVLISKGYSVSVPANTIMSAGRGRRINKITVADAGQFQVIE